MNDEALVIERTGPILRITFNRVARHNAVTWEMYDALFEALQSANSDQELRAIVLRGAGDQAFVAGTEIRQFAEFTDESDGIKYERRVTEVINALEDIPVPTVAVISGFCIGAGLVLASVCDLRIATRSASFGMPIARTVGNCLSINSHSILVEHWGRSRLMDMVLRARMFSATEAVDIGFVNEICEVDDANAAADATIDRLQRHAPLTMWATKQSLTKLRRSALPDDLDIVSRVYNSVDFHQAVRAFVAKERVEWTGR